MNQHQEEGDQMQQQQLLPQEQRQLQYTHDKDSEEMEAGGASSPGGAAIETPETITTTTTEATTTTTEATTTTPEPTPATITEEIHEIADHVKPIEQQIPEIKTEEEIKAEYEAQFPPVPETPRAATTFALFSDPDRFNPDVLADQTHYLSDKLEGTLWLDVNGDGIRGSESDSSLNAQEYDTGVGGVKLSLVECDTNVLAHSAVSMPNNGGEAYSFLKTQVPEAGMYTFNTDIIESGRYYVMYQAPTNYRLSGNILPLQREGNDEYFECQPKGGEGDEYKEEVEAKGDLDWGGYCARSIGCMEVDKAFNVLDEFSNYELVNLEEEDLVGTDKTLVALPNKSFLNVGLAEESWPLSTVQYADAQISLSFPGSVSNEDLRGAVNFDGESDLKKELEMAIGRALTSEGTSGAFDVQGVVLHGGHIKEDSTAKEGDGAAASEESSGASLRKRMLRGLQGDMEVATSNEPLGTTSRPADKLTSGESQVTYTFTTRGKYNPPPFEQLGSIISDSINRDPEGVVKSLKDREKSSLPPVFEEVEGAAVRHLTVKVEKPKNKPSLPTGDINSFAEAEGQGKSWSTILIILDVFLIAALVGVLIWRRVFTRRVKKDKRRHVELYLKGGSGFAVSDHHLDDDKKKSNKLDDRDIVRDAPGLRLEVDADRDMHRSTTESSDDDDSPSHHRRRGERSERSRNRRATQETMTSSGLSALRSSGITQQSGGSRSMASQSVSTSGSRNSRGSRDSRRSKGSKKQRDRTRRASVGDHAKSVRSSGGQTTLSAPSAIAGQGNGHERRNKGKSRRKVTRAQTERLDRNRSRSRGNGRMVHSLREEY